MLKIQVNNIGGLRGKHQFNLKKGLSILQAPNGSGKSSLIKAIHLLIGNTRIPPETLKNYLTEKEINGYVKIAFRDGGKNYEVQIQRKDSSVEIIYSNVEDDSFNFPSEELAYVRGTSELYQGVVNNDKTDLTSWYQRVTQIHKYQLFLDSSTKVLTGLKIKRDDLKKKASLDASFKQDQIQQKRQKINEYIKEREDIENSPSYIAFLNQNEEIKTTINGLKEEIEKLSNKKTNIRAKINSEETTLRQTKKDFKNKKKKLDLFLNEKPQKQQRMHQIEDEKDDLEVQLSGLESEASDDRSDIERKRGNLKEFKKLVNVSVCPTCKQKIDSNHFKQLVKQLESEIKKLEKQMRARKKRMDELEQKKSSLEREFYDIRDFLSMKQGKQRQEIQKLEKKIQSLEGRLSKKRKDMNQIYAKLEDKEKELKEIRDELSTESAETKKIAQLSGLESRLEGEIHKLQREIDESGDSQLEYLKMDKHVKYAEKVHAHYTEKVQHLENETMDSINEEIRKSFELLDLAKLKKVEFHKKDGYYGLDIQRANNVFTTLEKMSGAERSLITLIITWIVKNKVIPEEPLFLVDEVTTEMDDTRIKDILQHISENINYLVVARHSPYKGKKQVLSQDHIKAAFA